MKLTKWRGLLAFFVFVSISGSQCPPQGPPPKPPSLIANHCFSTRGGTVQTTITVVFTVQMGTDKFTSTETRPLGVAGDPRMCVDTRFYDLKPGSWTVTAANSVAGPAVCSNVTVPGVLTLDVSGNQGLRCKAQ